MLNAFIDNCHRSIAGSRFGLFVAAKLRNQTSSIFGHALSNGINPSVNGEEAMARRIGPKARVVFDVGANVGDWLSMFLRHAPNIRRAILIEPGIEASAALRRTYASDPRVMIVKAAASDHQGVETFYEGPSASTMSTIYASCAPKGSIKTEVQLVTVDEIARRAGIERIDMIKVDTEGHDFEVILGCRQLLSRRHIGAIQFEYGRNWIDAGRTLARALSFLSGFGYQTFLLKDNEVLPFDYERFGECFRYSNFAAVPVESIGELEVRGM